MARKLYRTPKGAARYPWLNKADEKYGDPKYKVDLVTDASDAADLCAQLEDLLEEHFDAVVEREEGDKYNEIFKEELPFFEEDGKVIFRSTLNKNGKNNKTKEEWENKITFYDAKAKPIPEDRVPAIGGGSILRLSAELNPWSMPETEGRGKNKVTNLKVGISLRLKAVQILEARTGGSQLSASEAGFEEEEDGYAYDPDAFDSDDADPDEDF